ncbi:hypothetical protein PACILC2_22280 [Paenibacillus cisolokensis]|uniref:PD(D/E)XK endonuclease domain-containing protein n=1 Tax=Paenibacillus cisolokensis TaxID=1658519 RepID=A0ABQ4N619_9BACL|nr:hypothetical protein [Paenibacillus cisolokensis]GIQ63660.1 hypothetical protein PACILC2_22280 [Paenibacillus cisolokensis]
MTKGRAKSTAHISEVVGKVSEMTARRALLNAGYIVAKPETDEPFDVVFRDPVNREWYTAQIKTIRVREDRDGALVVSARKSNGEPYAKPDADYIVGVLGDAVYMFENTGQAEYWAQEATASKRWVKLPTEIVRDQTAVAQ